MPPLDTCPTVKVEDGKGGYVVINEEDFVEGTHVLFTGEEPSDKGGNTGPVGDGYEDMNKDEIKVLLDKADVAYTGSMTKAELIAALREFDASVPK